MPVTKHPNFAMPHRGTVIWRYMDLSKFAAMLLKESLYFSRADCLGDPMEGSLAAANLKRRRKVLGRKVAAATRSHMAALMGPQSAYMTVNCWYAQRYESAAMWQLYGATVAVRSTVGRLERSLTCPESVHIGPVAYVDYDSELVEEGNVFAPFLFKRRSFEHEHEIRAVHWTLEGSTAMDEPPSGGGVDLAVELAALVTEVRVAPAAPAWQLEVVAGLCDRLGLAVPVRQSELDGERLF